MNRSISLVCKPNLYALHCLAEYLQFSSRDYYAIGDITSARSQMITIIAYQSCVGVLVGARLISINGVDVICSRLQDRQNHMGFGA